MDTPFKENLGTRRIPKLPDPALSRCRRHRTPDCHRPPAGEQGGRAAGQPALARRRHLDPHPAPRRPAQPREHDLAAGQPGADGGAAGAGLLGGDRRRHRPAHGLAGVRSAAARPPAALLPDPGDRADADQRHVRRLSRQAAWARRRWPSARTSRRCRARRCAAFPALDFVLRGEPELTLRELIDTLEVARGRWRGGRGRSARSTPQTDEPPRRHRSHLEDVERSRTRPGGRHGRCPPSRCEGAVAQGAESRRGLPILPRTPPEPAAGRRRRRSSARSRAWAGARPARSSSTRTGRSSAASTTCRCRCTTCCRSTSTACR